MNSLKAYGSDSSSSDDDSDNENLEQKKIRESEKTFHLKASTSTMLMVLTNNMSKPLNVVTIGPLFLIITLTE